VATSPRCLLFLSLRRLTNLYEVLSYPGTRHIIEAYLDRTRLRSANFRMSRLTDSKDADPRS
jgi:hypothetical protein